MKRLTCEMCGSTDLIKQEGVFVCQSCGCKYTVEEARKMMVEGTVEVQGTVKVDNSHLINNYLDMAASARDAGNNAEAESYCNKIIEIDPQNYLAWKLKGEAAAWQSSLRNSRVDEGVAAFTKAINFAPEEKKEEVTEFAKEQILHLSQAMLNLRADNFVKWPDEDESDGFLSDLTSILNTIESFIQQTGAEVRLADMIEPLARIISGATTRAWNSEIWPDYDGDKYDDDDRPTKYRYDRFMDRINNCIELEKQAIEISEDDDDNIVRYDDLIFLQEQAIDACSWDYEFSNGRKIWSKAWMLTDEAKDSRRDRIKGYEEKIKELKSRIAAKYWPDHCEEKERLDQEKSELTEKLDALQKEIDAADPQEKVKDFIQQINDLVQQKNALGMFKGKEKQALQDKIQDLTTQKEDLKAKASTVKKEIEDKMEPLKSRLKEVVARLEYPRDNQ